MIGFYNYSVILTYISLLSSVIGMMQAIHSRFNIAVICLAISGLCDTFDGKIARSMKNRTEDEKSFGIQIDSLCDVVCFGIFPALLCYQLGVNGWAGFLIIAFYCVNSVIRLAYFNVMEMRGALVDQEGTKYYRGLPITSMSVVLPLVFVIRYWVSEDIFRLALHAALFLVGLLFIVDFKFRKPKNSTLAILIVVVAVAILVILYTQRLIYLNYPRTVK